ncbi:TetR family transcriptional regulator [Achromobacter insuavis]
MRTKDFEPDEVADAAMQVFWRRGYAATSVQDLVDGTGLAAAASTTPSAASRACMKRRCGATTR